MKTSVRLPIYDEDGIQRPGYLEVDTTFWLSSTAGLRSNLARIVEPPEPLAEWEKDLLYGYEGLETVVKEEWTCLYGLIPTSAFEINRDGVIRIKANKKIVEPTWFDIDQNRYNVMLKINGMEYYLNGPKIAEELWGK